MKDYPALRREMQTLFPGLEIRENEPLARHCSFRIGGPAPLLLLPRSPQQIVRLYAFLAHKGVEPFLLGNGTNLLFPDAGLARPVIKTCRNIGYVTVQGNRVTAGCGATLASVATAARDAGLTGLEFAHGIPGSVGGGAVMNAGAYGGELQDVLVETEYMTEHFGWGLLRGAEHEFSYRHSVFSDRPWVVLQCVFELAPGDPAAISARMQELMEKRRASQPLDMPSAGSTFKRPVGGYAAALIDEAGLKGFTVGGAQVSPKHAGFVVNLGGATADDVLRLMDHIRTTVFARSGIELEPEVRIVKG